jgi:two-component system, cell cycle sensor histidine kinase DivJ
MFANFINRYLDDLVSPKVSADPVERGTHRAFMGLRIGFALVAMSIFPVYLIHAQTTTLLESMIFCWFVMPLLAVACLSKTGNYATSLLLSTVLSLPFLAGAAVMTGGAVASSFMIWLLTPLLEAILSKHRRAVIHTGLLILVTAIVIMASDYLQPVKTIILSADKATLISIVSVLAAILYVTLTAFVLEGVSNLGAKITAQNADKYRLLASNMTDAILRHDMHGNIRFASSAIEALTGIPAHNATRFGMVLSQIDPDDRDIYKAALLECLATQRPTSVVFKLVGAPEFANMSLDKRVSWLEEAINTSSNLKPLVWIEMKAQPVSDGSSEIVSVWRDVTARRLQETKIEGVQRETARIQAISPMNFARR